MSLLNKYLPCENIETIKDINDLYDYQDNNPGGIADSRLVSCGQTEGYNELAYIYNNKLEKHVKSGDITEEDAIKALCETCQEMTSPRNRDMFYKSLSSKLGVTIERTRVEKLLE